MHPRRSKTNKASLPHFVTAVESSRTPYDPKRDSQNPPATLIQPSTVVGDLATLSVTPPPNWPSTIEYLVHPVLSPYLPYSHSKWLRTKPKSSNTPDLDLRSSNNDEDLAVITLPLLPAETSSRVEIQTIEDERHPAFGQRGLFAVRDLAAGELVVGYLGYVHSSTALERAEVERLNLDRPAGPDLAANHAFGSEHHHALGPESETIPTVDIGQWDTSSYDLSMHRSEDIEVAVDAAQMGNEARFVNDYRGVPVQAKDRRDTDFQKTNERREKRKVKGWEGASSEEKYGGRQSYEIAMPNAEFRDVWFEIPGSLDQKLSPKGSDEHADLPKDLSIESVTERVSKIRLGRDQVSLDVRAEQRGKDCQLSSSSGKIGKLRRKKREGVRGVAIFVMPAGKAGKRKNGIRKGQEVLVSYGKGFWSHHGPNAESDGAEQLGKCTSSCGIEGAETTIKVSP